MSKQPVVKHVPQRTCVVCRETSAKRTLTRVVRTADNGVQIDPTGKHNGRGAYLCDKPACWHRAVDSDVLEKALRTTLTAQDRERLRGAIPVEQSTK
ncbi:MAG TPA: YlxR family protein [Aggregatilineales bacterium]|nr:YlxR family protein [Aggregatilineales bacterium]